MINATEFLNALKAAGVTSFSGTPCSQLKPFLKALDHDDEVRFVSASNEGEAIALNAGFYLAGEFGCAFSQNSGLGNMINPLTSLVEPFNIPMLLIISMRGNPPIEGEAQHDRMGAISEELLGLIGIECKQLPKDTRLAIQIAQAAVREAMNSCRAIALLIDEKSFETRATNVECMARENIMRMSRYQALDVIYQALPSHTAIVATTGHTSREILGGFDRANNFYCVGAMGYANAIAHGVALATTDPVAIIDGDGAVLMHLGNLSSISTTAPTNLTHIILDNQAHASTGGQPTNAANVDFPNTARALGYRSAVTCSSRRALKAALTGSSSGPLLIHVPISTHSQNALPRPKRSLPDLAQRWRSHLCRQQERQAS